MKSINCLNLMAVLKKNLFNKTFFFLQIGLSGIINLSVAPSIKNKNVKK
jgi:hypothetical protein